MKCEVRGNALVGGTFVSFRSQSSIRKSTGPATPIVIWSSSKFNGYALYQTRLVNCCHCSVYTLFIRALFLLSDSFYTALAFCHSRRLDCPVHPVWRKPCATAP